LQEKRLTLAINIVVKVATVALYAVIEGSRAIFAVVITTSGAFVIVVQIRTIAITAWAGNIWNALVFGWTHDITIIAFPAVVVEQSSILDYSDIPAVTDNFVGIWASPPPLLSFCPCQKSHERQADQSHQGG